MRFIELDLGLVTDEKGTRPLSPATARAFGRAFRGVQPEPPPAATIEIDALRGLVSREALRASAEALEACADALGITDERVRELLRGEVPGG